MSNGKLVDVLVQRKNYTDEKTSVSIPSHSLTVWADEGKTEIIKSVEGVTNVYSIITPTEYDVYLDERYDVNLVIKEIEAVILCS
jgi:hypothetical protein